MERLTNKDYEKDRFYLNCDPECKKPSCEECPDLIHTVKRLAEIEDILGDKYNLDRLRELVEADRDGRCVVLLCKVGDKIYKLFRKNVIELEVENIVCWSSGFWKLSAHTDRRYTHWNSFEIDFSDFGKTVFLNYEQAEAALNKMKEVESE